MVIHEGTLQNLPKNASMAAAPAGIRSITCSTASTTVSPPHLSMHKSFIITGNNQMTPGNSTGDEKKTLKTPTFPQNR